MGASAMPSLRSFGWKLDITGAERSKNLASSCVFWKLMPCSQIGNQRRRRYLRQPYIIVINIKLYDNLYNNIVYIRYIHIYNNIYNNIVYLYKITSYVYVYYIYIYTRTHIYIYTLIYIYIHIYWYTYMYIDVYTFIDIHICILMYWYIYIYTCT